MEVCDVVLRQQPPVWFSSSASVRELLQSSSSCCRLGLVGRRFFCDEGYLKYYCKSEKQGGVLVKDKGLKKMEKMEKMEKKKKKKQLKLLKGLSRDLSTFSQIGFGLDCDRTLVDQIKGNNISSAAELLLDQLQKIKAENKELKKRRKEEKKKLKGARLENRLNKCEMSSSSSSGSSSSDSECGEVIDMKSLKRAASTAQTNQIVELPVVEEPTSSIPFDSFPLSQLPLPDQNAPLPLELSAHNVEDECCSVIDRSCVSVANVSSLDNTSTTVSKKIEVCMGGKCKKTGAAALLEEFQRAVGIEGAVSGCKCMGKCREGPNVRVLNEMDGKVEDKKAKSSSNPLCIGVSMEDVDMIVANFLGENENENQNHRQLEFAA